MKIVCIGDSITYGYSLNRKDTWTHLSQEKTGFIISNKGINGDTIIGMLSRFERDVIKENPDIMFLMSGSNDILLSNSFENIKSSLVSIIQQSFSNGILPIIATPIPFYIEDISDIYKDFIDFNYSISLLNDYIDWIIEYSNLFRIDVIDFFNIFRKHFLNNNLDYKEYYLDGLHLNKKGNELFSEIFCDKIQKIIEKHRK